MCACLLEIVKRRGSVCLSVSRMMSKWKRGRQHNANSHAAVHVDAEPYEVKWDMPTEISATKLPYVSQKRLGDSPLNGVHMSEERRVRLQTIDQQADHAEWKSERPFLFGATNAVKAVGLGFGMTTPYVFARECAGLSKPDSPGIFGVQCMAYGTYHEPILLNIYARETGFSVSKTGYHGMRTVADMRQPWLVTYLEMFEEACPVSHSAALRSLDLPYLVVSPDGLVDMRGSTGGVSNICKRFYDLDIYYATGVVEGKSRINATRNPYQSTAAVLQMLTQMVATELDEQDLTDKATVRTKWADLCEYSCVTKLSSKFRFGRSCGVPQQRCEAWRVQIEDISVVVDLCEIIRRFRESLDCVGMYNSETFPIGHTAWKTLDLNNKLRYTPIFKISDDSCPDPIDIAV
jgi:hypothetical protein